MKGFGIRSLLRRLEYSTQVFQSFKDERSSHTSTDSGSYKERLSSYQTLTAANNTEADCCCCRCGNSDDRQIDYGFSTYSTEEEDDDDTVFEDCLDSTEHWQNEEEAELINDHHHGEEEFDNKYSSEEAVVQYSTTSLTDFEENCPPGGIESVILYTTSLRGIRKTFEDCRRVKFLLDSFGILYYERDVSLHLEFREELRRMLGGGGGGTAAAAAVPPRLFVKGRDLGGADEVVELHEQGMLQDLLQGIALDVAHGRKSCGGCAGVGFVLCGDCNGSRKLLFSLCGSCNENGLVKCPLCC